MKEIEPTEFWSLENAGAHGAVINDLWPLRESVVGKRKYLFYRDQEGRGWYRVQLLTSDGWKWEDQVFGQRKRTG